MGFSKLLGAVTLLAALAIPVFGADRALVVGIDVYQDPRVPPTPGAKEDALAMVSLLQGTFDFPGDSVRVLLDDQATADRILREFETWLIEGTDPGDRVFFFYAGHGSQLKDDNGDEKDTYDETLAPFDVVPGGSEGQIRDDRIDALIARLSGRRSVLVFDSCHSGTLTRSLPAEGSSPMGGGVRYLPRPDQFERLWAAEAGFRTRGASDDPTYGLRRNADADSRPFDRPERYGGLSGIVTISAAGPGQLAYPITTPEGAPRGALSYVFQQIYGDPDSELARGLLSDISGKVLKQAGSTLSTTAVAAASGATAGLGEAAVSDLRHGVSVATLETSIRHGIQQLQREGRLQGEQEPWFEVISEHPVRDQSLFGDGAQVPAVALHNPVTPMVVRLSTGDGRERYEAGEGLEFEVSSSRGGYLYLMVFSEGRIATCIYPNPQDRENWMEAGEQRIPHDSEYHFPVQAPFGRDIVVALVSERRRHLCEKVQYRWEELLSILDLAQVDELLEQRTRRGIGVAAGPSSQAAYSPDDGQNWQIDSLILETGP